MNNSSKNELRLVHLQLTYACNLRCWFCGQHGKRGFADDDNMPRSRELTPREWERIIAELAGLKQTQGFLPQVVIWGGEPLLYPGIRELLPLLHGHGFEVGMVTNGVRLPDFAAMINKTLKTLYVSIDGPQEVHEHIRGVPGIYPRIIQGMGMIDSTRLMTVCMFTLSATNYMHAVDFPLEAAKYNFRKILISNLIFLTREEGKQYARWLKDAFGVVACHAESWLLDPAEPYLDELPQILCRIEENIRAGEYPLEVELVPQGITSKTVLRYYRDPKGLATGELSHPHCLAPFQHLNICPDGDVHLCVDHNDLIVGNVRESGLMDIFRNEKADRLRREIAVNNNPACRHCPWRFNTRVALD